MAQEKDPRLVVGDLLGGIYGAYAVSRTLAPTVMTSYDVAEQVLAALADAGFIVLDRSETDPVRHFQP